jgi:hypothetical protein
MKLLTPELLASLPPLYAQEKVPDPVVHAIALVATVEIMGPAKQAGSVHKIHGHLALAESYRERQSKAKRNLETHVEYVPRPRRWPSS